MNAKPRPKEWWNWMLTAVYRGYPYSLRFILFIIIYLLLCCRKFSTFTFVFMPFCAKRKQTIKFLFWVSTQSTRLLHISLCMGTLLTNVRQIFGMLTFPNISNQRQQCQLHLLTCTRLTAINFSILFIVKQI